MADAALVHPPLPALPVPTMPPDKVSRLSPKQQLAARRVADAAIPDDQRVAAQGPGEVETALASCTQRPRGSRRTGTFDTLLLMCLNWIQLTDCFYLGKVPGQNLIKSSYMRDPTIRPSAALHSSTELSTQFVDKAKIPTDSNT